MTLLYLALGFGSSLLAIGFFEAYAKVIVALAYFILALVHAKHDRDKD